MEVSLVGDVGELGHHKPDAVAVHADAHRLCLFSLFAMFGSPRTVTTLLAILALNTVPGIVALDTASVAGDIPGRAITDPLQGRAPLLGVAAGVTAAVTAVSPQTVPRSAFACFLRAINSTISVVLLSVFSSPRRSARI